MKIFHARHIVVIASLFPLMSTVAVAEKGKLLVLVQDIRQHPINGLKIGIEGGGDSRTTGQDGKVILTLTGNTKENDWVSFQIIESPPGEDLVIVAPANHRHPVPSFDDKADNFVLIVVVPRNIYMALMTQAKMRESTARIQNTRGKR